MITAGIDSGARTVKAIVLKDGGIAGKAIEVAGTDTERAVNAVYDAALKEAGLSREDVEKVVATGAGRKRISFLPGLVTEITAAARGVHALLPEARTVIDIGSEEARVVKIDENGGVVDFAVNDKCAAGAGAFTEAMARALETSVEELGPLSLKSTRVVPINAQCVVFAESEVVTLIHAKTPKEDIARALHNTISRRITSMVRRVGVNREIALIGGVSKNAGFVESLKRDLKADLIVPEVAEFVGALGAAVTAAKK